MIGLSLIQGQGYEVLMEPLHDTAWEGQCDRIRALLRRKGPLSVDCCDMHIFGHTAACWRLKTANSKPYACSWSWVRTRR